MKSTLIATASVVGLCTTAFAQSADTAPAPAAAVAQKIVTINMEKIFNDFYKTRDALQEVRAYEEEIQEGNTKRLESIKAIEKDLEGMQKQLQDTSTPEADRAKIMEAFNMRRADGMAQEKDRQEFVNRKMKTLEITRNGKIQTLVGEINKVIQEKAAAGDYDLVIDVSSKTAAQTLIVPFSNSKLDITEEIIKEVNKDAPEGYDPSQNSPSAPLPAPAPEAAE